MPDDNDEEEDSGKTPVEPLMERKRTSQRAMVAIGWKTCPDCEGIEGVHCDTCFDPETRMYDRRLPPDKYIAWIHANPGRAPIEKK
jgi:hypothetical protein